MGSSRLPVIGMIEEDKYILEMLTVVGDEMSWVADIMLQVFGVKS